MSGLLVPMSTEDVREVLPNVFIQSGEVKVSHISLMRNHDDVIVFLVSLHSHRARALDAGYQGHQRSIHLYARSDHSTTNRSYEHGRLHHPTVISFDIPNPQEWAPVITAEDNRVYVMLSKTTTPAIATSDVIEEFINDQEYQTHDRMIAHHLANRQRVRLA